MSGFSKVWKTLAATLLLALPAVRADDEVVYEHAAGGSPEQARTVAELAHETLSAQLLDVASALRPELKSAVALYRHGDWAGVIAILKPLIEQDPTVLQAWELLGDAYLRSSQKSEAINLWGQLEVIRPDYAPVYNWLGRFYMLQNKLPEATEAFRTSLKIDPDQPQTQLNLARVRRWSGHLSDAVEMLRPLAQANPQRLDIVRELASGLLSDRHYPEALPLWQKLRATDPTNELFQAKEAVALLHNGHVPEAVAEAHDVLAADPDQSDALGVMADASQFFSEQPEDAFSWILHLRQITDKPLRYRQLTLRYVNLYGRLNNAAPARFPMDRTVPWLQELSSREPYNADVRLALAETLMMCFQYDAAREQLEWVLAHLNPNNIRAQRNLFEIALAQHRHAEAERYLQEFMTFNPRDPYRHFYLARLYAEEQRYHAAEEELQALEATGRQGAVAILLYHGLSSSDNGEIMPANRLCEHMKKLRAAGFRFITADMLPAYFEGSALLANADSDRPAPLDRVACVTFDDARRDTMLYGTPVAEELKMVFSLLVPIGFIEGPDPPFFCSWEKLREYEATHCWIFGGHSYFAHARTAIDDQLREGFALPNHIWLPAEGRLENDAEYAQRLEHEYTGCHDAIVHELGHAAECNFFAYPFGDIGQLTRSNDPQAPQKNLAACGRAFAVGLIQTTFGYAVIGDNPLLYQRMEPDRLDTGADVLRHVLENHPVNVARRLRVQFAAEEGKRYLVRDTLLAMLADGYPTESLLLLRAKAEHILNRSIPMEELDRAAATNGIAPAAGVLPLPAPAKPQQTPRDEKPSGLRNMHNPLF